MNKILIIVMVVFCLFACSDNKQYNIHCNYDVCYPDTTITYDTIFQCDYGYSEDTTLYVAIGSSRGSNYIFINPGRNYRMSTTAPIRLNSYNIIK